MKLTDLLTENVLLAEMKALNAPEAINELLEVLVEAKQLPLGTLEHARRIVHERERSMSTGIGRGVAIPHGTLQGLDGVVGAMGRSRGGIEFNAIDGEPVRIVVLVLVGESAYRQHIRTLAIVSRLLNSAALRDRLLEASTPGEMLRLIRSEESGDLSAERAP